MTLTLSQLLLTILGTVLTGLATWAVSALTTWLNTKIKDKKVARFLTELTDVVANCVKTVYQTYVEDIKGTDLWNQETQQEALKKALEMAKSQLSTEVTAYVAENFGDVEEYLKTLVESILYNLKNK